MFSAQEGLTLPSMERQREAAVTRVEDAFAPPQVVVLAAERIGDAARRVRESGASHVLAQPRPGLWTIVSAEAIAALAEEGKEELPAGSMLGLATPVPVVYPDEPLDAALRAFGENPFLPVVHRASAAELVGVVTLESVLAAYRRA